MYKIRYAIRTFGVQCIVFALGYILYFTSFQYFILLHASEGKITHFGLP